VCTHQQPQSAPPMSSSDEEAPRRKTSTRSREALYSQGTPPSRQRAAVRPRLLAAAAEDEDFEDGARLYVSQANGL
jgi:hypothetical protein